MSLASTVIITKGLYGGDAFKGLITSQLSLYIEIIKVSPPSYISAGGGSILAQTSPNITISKIFSSKMLNIRHSKYIGYKNFDGEEVKILIDPLEIDLTNYLIKSEGQFRIYKQLFIATPDDNKLTNVNYNLNKEKDKST
jgi:hypothetical protein